MAIVNTRAAIEPKTGKAAIFVNETFYSLIRKLFSNNEQGFFYDPNDLTEEKIKWRRNLFNETEFRNGITDASIKSGSLSPVAFAGLTVGTGIQVDPSTSVTYLYKSVRYKADTPYTFSCYVRMLDGSSPRVGESSVGSEADMHLVVKGAAVKAEVQNLGDGLYRIFATVAGAITGNYFGVVKYPTNSSKPVIVSGFQLEEGLLTAYQPFTDYTSEFLQQFPLHTLYQDAAGTIPITAAGQPVGLVLDKSKGLVLGSNLATTTSVIGTGIGGTEFKTVTVSTALETGFWYKITINVSNYSGSGDAGITGTNTAFPLSTIPTGIRSRSSDGLISFIALAQTNNAVVLYTRNANNADFTGITIQKISGNHAYQITSSSRPLLGRHPISGARNLATYSNNPNDVSWGFASGVRTANQLDSKGGYTATRFRGPSTSNTVKQARSIKAGSYTYTVCLKAGPQHTAKTNVLLRNATTAVNFQNGSVDLVTGVITGAGWSSKPKPNGFWECTFTQSTGIAAGDSLLLYFGATDITTDTFDIIVDYMQIEAGAVSTPFQETTSLLDITENGVPSTYYLAFDGIDDSLQTNSIDFTATDKVSLFAGVRKLSDANAAILCELGSDININNGSFYLAAPLNATTKGFALNAKGTIAGAAVTTLNNIAPASAVLTGYADLRSTQLKLRLTGIVNTAEVSLGVGNYGNYPLYICRRGGTSIPFTGHIYGLIGIARLTTDSETIALEKSIAKNVGVTL